MWNIPNNEIFSKKTLRTTNFNRGTIFEIIHVSIFYYILKNYLTIADSFAEFADAIPTTRTTAINVSDVYEIIHKFWYSLKNHFRQ